MEAEYYSKRAVEFSKKFFYFNFRLNAPALTLKFLTSLARVNVNQNADFKFKEADDLALNVFVIKKRSKE